jgi:hypothetical protein
MKVFALGGYGKTALPAVEILTKNDLVSAITIAGRNLERAQKAAVELGDKVTAVQADGTDMQVMKSHLQDREYDIVMNVAFYDTVLPTIQACIQTGTPYCDAATWGDSVAKTLQLAPQAADAGITAIVATGISPCISNLMGVYAAHQLDNVEQLQIGRADIYDFQTGHELTPAQWTQNPQQSLSALQEFKSFFTWMFKRVQENGIKPIHVYRSGQWVEIDPAKEGWTVPSIDGGLSTAYPYYCCDDSWGSLPHDLSSAAPVEVGHSPFPPQLDSLLRDLSLRITKNDINAEMAVSHIFTVVGQNPQHWLTASDIFVPPAKMWVNAVGSKHGRAVRSTCYLSAPMWDVGGYFLTSVALAVSVVKILRREVHEPGVVTAEKAFDPQSFFDEVENYLPELAGEKMTGHSFEWLA